METLIAIGAAGAIWNAALQTYWFFWSRSLHKEEKRKHFTDDLDYIETGSAPAESTKSTKN